MATATTTTTTGKKKTTTPVVVPTPAGKSKTTPPVGKSKTVITPNPSGKTTTTTKTGSGSTSSTPPGPGSVGAAGTYTAVNPIDLPADAPGAFAWTDYAIKWGSEIGVPPEIIMSLIQAESGGNQFVVGDGGASVGLFQLHERGVGSGLSVEERYNPETQFRLMAPRIQAAYQAGVAKGLTGRDLAMYTGYYAEKPAAGYEANYAYAYDVVTGYMAGNIVYGGAPTNLPSGGNPTSPWGSYSRGGSRTAPLIGDGTLPIYSYDPATAGQGVVEGLYGDNPWTFSGGSGSGSSTTGSGIVNGIVGGVGSVVGGTAAQQSTALIGSIASGIAGLFKGAAYQQGRVDDGETVELFGTPLGPLGIPVSSLYGGGFLVAGLVLAAGGVFLIARRFK